jgi:hypothetical protein
MTELIIVESIIGIFLLLHIVRPYINAFQEADGFVFFPVAALLCCIAMIPAYGARPECLPLFLFTAAYNIFYFPSVAAIISGLKKRPVQDDSLPLSFLATTVLILSLVVAFHFAPSEEQPNSNAQKTQFTVSDSARGNIELFVSYYQGNRNDLILVTPPVTMPLSMIEDICFALSRAGYKILAFSRPRFDNSAIDEKGKSVELSINKKTNRYIRAASGVKNIKMIQLQRDDAAEREADIRFLLSALNTEPLLKEIIPHYENIFLLGYGAGGAASIELSGDGNFLQANPAVKAVAAIESIVLCDFSERKYEPGKNILRNIGGMFGRFFKKPALQMENIPHPKIPVLFVAGDGAQGKNRYSRYTAVVQTMLESESPFLFASINGIHATDFSALPRKYPVFTLFFKGKKEGVWPGEDTTSNTAGYIASFFSLAKSNTSVSYLSGNLAAPDGAVFMETSRQMKEDKR